MGAFPIQTNMTAARRSADRRRAYATRMPIAALPAQLALRPHFYSTILPVLCLLPGILTQDGRWSGQIDHRSALFPTGVR